MERWGVSHTWNCAGTLEARCWAVTVCSHDTWACTGTWWCHCTKPGLKRCSLNWGARREREPCNGAGKFPQSIGTSNWDLKAHWLIRTPATRIWSVSGPELITKSWAIFRPLNGHLFSHFFVRPSIPQWADKNLLECISTTVRSFYQPKAKRNLSRTIIAYLTLHLFCGY